MSEKDNWLSVKEIAEKLKVGEKTVREYCKSGDLKAFQNPVSKEWRATEEAVNAFMTGEKVVEAEEGKPTYLLENQPLGEEVEVGEERLLLEGRKRELADKKSAFDRGITFEEAEAFKRETLEGMEVLVKREQEFAEQKEARIIKFKEKDDRIAVLEAELIEKDKTIEDLTVLMGGVKVAKRELSAKERDEAKAVELERKKERDKIGYPYLSTIPRGVILLYDCADEARQYGYRGVSLSAFLGKWCKEILEFATYYKVVKPASNHKRDIAKAEAEMEKAKDRARGNYAWAMDIFRICNKVILHKGYDFHLDSEVKIGGLLRKGNKVVYEDGRGDVEVAKWLFDVSEKLVELMGMEEELSEEDKERSEGKFPVIIG